LGSATSQSFAQCERGVGYDGLAVGPKETKVGGMNLIPKGIDNNGARMELMKSLLRQLHREAFLKSFTIALA
jgi:hypothetical protein